MPDADILWQILSPIVDWPAVFGDRLRYEWKLRFVDHI